jgi:hypothetical protein
MQWNKIVSKKMLMFFGLVIVLFYSFRFGSIVSLRFFLVSILLFFFTNSNHEFVWIYMLNFDIFIGNLLTKRKPK